MPGECAEMEEEGEALRMCHDIEVNTVETDKLDSSSDGQKPVKFVKRQFFIFCLSVLCSVSSYSGLMDLQSSINVSDALGNKSLAVMSISTIVFSLFFTPVVVQAFGAKYAIITSEVCYLLYVLANFYPAFYTLLPAGAVFGMGEAMLYTPALMYCTFYGRRQARLESKNQKESVNKFVGFYWGMYHMNEIIGNLISTVVLGIGKSLSESDGDILTNFSGTSTATQRYAQQAFLPPRDDNATISGMNVTGTVTYQSFIIDASHTKVETEFIFYIQATDESTTMAATRGSVTSSDFSMCAANNCYEDNDIESAVGNYSPMSSTSFYVMVAINAFLATIAIPMMFYVPSLPKAEIDKKDIDSQAKKSCQACVYLNMMKLNVKQTMKQLFDPQQLLMMPLTLYHGLYVSFISSEITRAYVSCTVGVEKVGIGMLAGGIMNSTVAFAFGYLAGILIARKLFLILAIVIDLGLYVFCLLWQPTSDTAFFAYVICLLFGCTDGVWSAYLDGKYAKYFPETEEISYSIQVIWSCIGFSLTYLWTALLCVRVKIYIQIFSLFIGIACCFGAELLEKRKRLHSTSTVKENLTL